MIPPGFKLECLRERVAIGLVELANARAALAARLAPYVSRSWILREILNLTETEIQALERQTRAYEQ